MLHHDLSIFPANLLLRTKNKIRHTSFDIHRIFENRHLEHPPSTILFSVYFISEQTALAYATGSSMGSPSIRSA